ncbi:zinc finger protein 449-like [Acipenser ruthenus]|uniref:zinc finger protein 449-like n=1 Tax=Acipenser ruthenus TaxID=7906 RepID=UPI0027424018|nr:zinc finger protein 449-like [Acipenser ruthenus]
MKMDFSANSYSNMSSDVNTLTPDLQIGSKRPEEINMDSGTTSNSNTNTGVNALTPDSQIHNKTQQDVRTDLNLESDSGNKSRKRKQSGTNPIGKHALNTETTNPTTIPKSGASTIRSLELGSDWGLSCESKRHERKQQLRLDFSETTGSDQGLNVAEDTKLVCYGLFSDLNLETASPRHNTKLNREGMQRSQCPNHGIRNTKAKLSIGLHTEHGTSCQVTKQELQNAAGNLQNTDSESELDFDSKPRCQNKKRKAKRTKETRQDILTRVGLNAAGNSQSTDSGSELDLDTKQDTKPKVMQKKMQEENRTHINTKAARNSQKTDSETDLDFDPGPRCQDAIRDTKQKAQRGTKHKQAHKPDCPQSLLPAPPETSDPEDLYSARGVLLIDAMGVPYTLCMRPILTPKSGELQSDTELSRATGSPQPTHIKAYVCTVCSRAFPYRSYLERHRISHLEMKPYVCTDCGKAFKRSSHLARHRHVHSDAGKPFQCTVCQKGFREPGELLQHQRVHTGERPYQCQVCRMRFTERTTLRRHCQRKHSAEEQGHKYEPEAGTVSDLTAI